MDTKMDQSETFQTEETDQRQRWRWKQSEQNEEIEDLIFILEEEREESSYDH